jgi:hypothetical protein
MLYLLISKRAKFLPFLLVIIFGFSFVVSTSIIERASKGLGSKDRHEISAGRIDNIWIPLIDEYLENPKKLLFGNGRYAIISSDSAARGVILDVRNPHSMYLEQILDAGIIGLLIVMLFYVYLFKKIYKCIGAIKDVKTREYLYAVIVAMMSFFIAGITGRSLFPRVSNSYFWIILGVALAILMIQENSGDHVRNET